MLRHSNYTNYYPNNRHNSSRYLNYGKSKHPRHENHHSSRNHHHHSGYEKNSIYSNYSKSHNNKNKYDPRHYYKSKYLVETSSQYNDNLTYRSYNTINSYKDKIIVPRKIAIQKKMLERANCFPVTSGSSYNYGSYNNFGNTSNFHQYPHNLQAPIPFKPMWQNQFNCIPKAQPIYLDKLNTSIMKNTLSRKRKLENFNNLHNIHNSYATSIDPNLVDPLSIYYNQQINLEHTKTVKRKKLSLSLLPKLCPIGSGFKSMLSNLSTSKSNKTSKSEVINTQIGGQPNNGLHKNSKRSPNLMNSYLEDCQRASTKLNVHDQEFLNKQLDDNKTSLNLLDEDNPIEAYKNSKKMMVRPYSSLKKNLDKIQEVQETPLLDHKSNKNHDRVTNCDPNTKRSSLKKATCQSDNTSIDSGKATTLTSSSDLPLSSYNYIKTRSKSKSKSKLYRERELSLDKSLSRKSFPRLSLLNLAKSKRSLFTSTTSSDLTESSFLTKSSETTTSSGHTFTVLKDLSHKLSKLSIKLDYIDSKRTSINYENVSFSKPSRPGSRMSRPRSYRDSSLPYAHDFEHGQFNRSKTPRKSILKSESKHQTKTRESKHHKKSPTSLKYDKIAEKNLVDIITKALNQQKLRQSSINSIESFTNVKHPKNFDEKVEFFSQKLLSQEMQVKSNTARHKNRRYENIECLLDSDQKTLTKGKRSRLKSEPIIDLSASPEIHNTKDSNFTPNNTFDAPNPTKFLSKLNKTRDSSKSLVTHLTNQAKNNTKHLHNNLANTQNSLPLKLQRRPTKKEIERLNSQDREEVFRKLSIRSKHYCLFSDLSVKNENNKKQEEKQQIFTEPGLDQNNNPQKLDYKQNCETIPLRLK